MNNVTFGAYYPANSWLHRLDPRCKLLSVLLLMVGIFFVKQIEYLAIVLVLLIGLIVSSRVPFGQFLKSVRLLGTILVFTFIFQVLFNHSGEELYRPVFNLSLLTITLGFGTIILFFLSKYIFKKGRMLIFLITLVVIFGIQYFLDVDTFKTYSIGLYDEALYTSFKVLLRIVSLVILSSSLTFTTKPTDIARALENLLKPLKKVKIDTDTFAMMIFIALRFVPELINEAQKILKSQASRGVEFKEGSLKKKVTQIVSLIVPMFIVSYHKADDLATAMEAKGYNPGSERTRLYIMKYKTRDYLTYTFSLLLTTGMILVGALL